MLNIPNNLLSYHIQVHSTQLIMLDALLSMAKRIRKDVNEYHTKVWECRHFIYVQRKAMLMRGAAYGK